MDSPSSIDDLISDLHDLLTEQEEHTEELKTNVEMALERVDDLLNRFWD